LLSACASAGDSLDAAPSAISQRPVFNPPAQTSGAIPTLAPLTIADFPQTTDGRQARDVCEQWAKLRTEYVSAVVNDSPYQLNQWFSGPDWAKAEAGMSNIGGDPTYTNLSAAYAEATIGDMADDSTARQLDKACADGV
jgi:hypothetical protein